jgi:hypothetical protein
MLKDPEGINAEGIENHAISSVVELVEAIEPAPCDASESALSRVLL